MSELAPEGAPVEGAPVEPTPAAEPAWAPPQEEWEAVTQGLGYVLQQLQPQQQRPAIDPYADDFQNQLDQYFEQRMQERLGPLQQFHQDVQLGEAEERAMDILTDIQTREGEFLLPDSVRTARTLAGEFVQGHLARAGFPQPGTPAAAKAAEGALTDAYNAVKEWEQNVGKAYYDRQMNQIRGLSSAPREPNAAGQAGQSVALPQGGNELDLVRSYFANR